MKHEPHSRGNVRAAAARFFTPHHAADHKTILTSATIALAVASTFSFNANAQAVEWVAGQTRVSNGEQVIYQGQCYRAQNNPGTWETPTSSAAWFWTPVECTDTPVSPQPSVAPTLSPTLTPTVSPTVSPTQIPTPAPEGVVEWQAGKTKVSNGDLVEYRGQCYQAKNRPGVWETPVATSWFWQVVECPQAPVPTAVPTSVPTAVPTTAPTLTPTPFPTVVPTSVPTLAPTPLPTVVPTSVPTLAPTPLPTVVPTSVPTLAPTPLPTTEPTIIPTLAPSEPPVAGNIWYVSPDGSDGNDGSIDAPLASLKKAGTKAQPGDRIELLSGRYQTAQVLDKVAGSAQAPIVVSGKDVVIDGTIDINSSWKRYQGNIYQTQLNQDVWQLFVGDEMVMSARWPNAQLKDGSLWDMQATWRHQAPASSFGTMIDERPYQSIKVSNNGNTYTPLPVGVNSQSLADSDIDATGAIAIMNIGSWLNWAQRVESHNAGSDRFSYSTDFTGSGSAMKNAANNILNNDSFWQAKNVKYEEGHYYLEGKLAFLDSPNEWFYEPSTKTVYLWAPEGVDPNQLEVKAKTQTYGLTVRNASHVQFEQLNFFATAFTVVNSHNVVFKDITAQYYAYSKRMLGQLTRPETIKFINNNKAITETNNAIVDSYLAYTDGPAFEFIKETYDTIDNNLIHDIDYSNLGTGGEGSLNMAQQSRGIVFTNNTFHTAGNSEGVRVGAESVVRGNRVYNTSLLQHDGAAINVGVAEQAGTEIAYNWVHDSPKSGIRFDGVEGAAKTGRDGVVHHNAVWNTAFSIIKGNYQGTYNNLIFNSDKADLIIFNKQDAGGINLASETLNNLVGSLQGRKSGTPQQLEVPGLQGSNVLSQDMSSYLQGPAWGDFRAWPLAGLTDAGEQGSLFALGYQESNPDIGPYEAGETYWIPGHVHDRAEHPVPFDTADSVSLTPTLMFKLAKGSTGKVYFGDNPTSLTYLGSESALPLTALQPATTYYWRVDSQHAGITQQGQVWRFTTAN
ncbi:right-handed parallel beta-helix repeat-containing protein [Motilimonas pumila]|uniref:Chitin-binding type-3 domain-containing protein n=1 Tax=Motilimonas pumila TaxID=2303987 RepID=A0A418YHT8_9GAMM|nr:right-handed parallel beta-helix repeat-containing protein [Motilimonas pumila]RJG49897.1 hypothetical protein D1Z90_04430 [Motilimonas pumila]